MKYRLARETHVTPEDIIDIPQDAIGVNIVTNASGLTKSVEWLERCADEGCESADSEVTEDTSGEAVSEPQQNKSVEEAASEVVNDE